MTRRALAASLLVALIACGGDGGDVAAGGERGAEVYANVCAQCHGPVGEGTAVGPPLVHDYYEPSHHSDDAFVRAIREGVVPHHWDFGPMPPQPQVTDEDVPRVIEHIRGLQRDAGIH